MFTAVVQISQVFKVISQGERQGCYLPLVGKIRVRLVVHGEQFFAQLREVRNAPVTQLHQQVKGRDARCRVRTSETQSNSEVSTARKTCDSFCNG